MVDLLIDVVIANGRAGHAQTATLALDNVYRREERLGTDDPALIPALLGLSEVFTAQADFQQAIYAATRALTLSERSFGRDSLRVATALDRLGQAFAGAGRFVEALDIFERSLAIKQATSSISNEAIAGTLENTAWVLQRRGAYDRSGRAVRRAVALRQLTDPEQPPLAKALGLLADQLWFEGDLSASKSAAERAVAIAETTLRPDHPMLASLLRDLASTSGSRVSGRITGAETTRAGNGRARSGPSPPRHCRVS